ncbi:MAG: hydroxypyruvate isomerase family protein [Halobacteriaceae archaeon]
MVRLSVVPWGFFGGESLATAFERTAAAGADAIEVLDPDGHSPGELADMAQDHGVDIATYSVRGETSGIDNVAPAVADPDSREQAVADLEESIDEAEEAGAHNVLLTVGQAQDDRAPHEQHVALVDVFREVAPAAEDAGVTVVPEVLNTRVDHPGYYLSSSYEAYEIVHAVDSPNVRVLYDIYHQQITEGNVIDNLRSNVGYVGHMHFADVPGRHEPGTGEIHFERVFEAVDEAGYDGFVGAELGPTGDPDAVLEDVVDLAH